MFIRYGYDIEAFCPEAIFMVTLLDAHPDHIQDIKALGAFESQPPLTAQTFVDAYGNEVMRFVAPPGVHVSIETPFIEAMARISLSFGC